MAVKTLRVALGCSPLRGIGALLWRKHVKRDRPITAGELVKLAHDPIMDALNRSHLNTLQTRVIRYK